MPMPPRRLLLAFYPAIPASDGTSMTAPVNAPFEVFELSDTSFSNPLALQSTAGLNAAPLVTTAQGVLPPVNVVSPNFSHIFKSGEWEWRRDSFDGAQQATEQAAADASRAREAAEEAARNSAAPTQEAVAAALTTDGPAREALGAEVREATSGLAVKPDNGSKPVGKGELVVNVKDHGAKGDGISDDLVAFQSAMAEVGVRGGGTLLLPPGTYNISSVVSVTDNVTISGYGATITRGFYGLSTRGTGYGAGPRNVSIRGLRFLGSFVGTQRVVGMQWHHAQNLTAEDCIFEQGTAWGHTFDLQGCDGVTIRNCVWLGFNPERSPHAEAIQCDVSALGGASMTETDAARYDGLPTRNVLVERCQFLPLTVDGTTYPCPNPIGSHGGVEGTFYDNITFRNNIVRHPTSEHAWYPGAIHFIGARGLKIHDNTFEGLPGTSGIAIALNDGRYVIHPSEVRLASPATHVSDNPITPRSISIRGNTFVGWTVGSSVIDITGDVRGHYAKGIDIRENEFRDGIPAAGTAPNPLLIRWAEGVHVVGNNFANVRRLGDFGDCRGVQIDSNNLSDGVNNGIYAARTSGLQITANEMKRIAIFLNLDQINGLLVANNGFEEGSATAGYGILNAITAGIMTLNRVRGVTSAYGFSWRGATTRSQCRSNIIDGTITKGVDVVSPAVVDVGGNI